MPSPRSAVEGPLKFTKYKQAKRRRENRKRRRLADEEKDRQFPQSKLEDMDND